jgi:hypothetical protein
MGDILSNIASGVMTPIMTPIMGAFDGQPFALIWKGAPADYTSYTRLDPAYAESPSGAVVEVAQDVPPYEYVDGTKRLRQYDGINLVPEPEDPSSWTLADGATYNPTTGEHTIPQNGSIILVNIVGPGYENDTYKSFISADIVSGAGVLRLFDGVSSSNSVLSSFTTLEKTFAPTATRLSLFVRSDDSGVPLVVKLSSPSLSDKDIPYIPVGNQQVNAGTTSLLAEDIDDASILANGTSDKITLDNPVILGTNDFNFKANFRSTDLSVNGCLTGELENGAFIVQINSDGTISIVESGITTVYTSTLAISANETVSLEYDRVYSGISTLTVNGTSESVTDNQNYDGRNGLLLSRLSGNYFKGYAWGLSLSVGGSTNFSYTLAQYRQDVEIVDTSGNGNHAQLSRNVNLALVENQGFGYQVNAKAPTMGTYTTDDNVVVQKTLREFFGGEARGVDTTNNYDFTTWAASADCVVNSPTEFETSSGFRYIRKDGLFTVGERYQMQVTSTSSGVVRALSFGLGDIYCATLEDCIFTATDTGITFQAVDADTVDITELEIRKVYPAVGVIPFTAYIPHALTADMPLIQFQDSDFVPLYVEQTTGLIKGTDDTNTCVSASAVTAGSEVSGWFSFNEDEMWITLEGTKGTIATFAGYFPETGNRILGMTSGTYHTVRNVFFQDTLNFSFVVHDGVQVIEDGKFVIQYL